MSAYRRNSYRPKQISTTFKKVEAGWVDKWNCFREKHLYISTGVCIDISLSHPNFVCKPFHRHELYLCVFCLAAAVSADWCYVGHLEHYHPSDPTLCSIETNGCPDIMDVKDIVDPFWENDE